MPGRATTEEDLLIERLAAWLGFEAIASRLKPLDIYPPYLYIGTFVMVNVIFGQAYYYWVSGRIGLLENPFGLALPLGVIVATVGIHYMHRAATSAELRLEENNQLAPDTTLYRSGFSLRSKFALYFVVLAGFLFWEIFVVGIGTLMETQGPVLAVFYNLLVLPLAFIPVGVEFVLLYISVHFLLPRRLSRADLKLFFLDTRNMGGFQPVGELYKRSYYFFTAGLLLYLAFFYGPAFVQGVSSDEAIQTGVFTAVLFTILWLIGVATLSYSMYKTHNIMSREKDQRLNEIEAELDDAITNPHDIGSAEITDQEKLEAIQFRLEQIRSTSEYPTTFTMWTQIAISVLLPQILQMTLQSTL